MYYSCNVKKKYRFFHKIYSQRGQKGGLSEYARLVGKSQQILSQYSQAAKVVTQFTSLEMNELLDKAKHLSYIHQLPEPTWQQAVERMLKKEWSAKETQEQVKVAKNIRDIPQQQPG